MFEPNENECEHSICYFLLGKDDIESPDAKREILNFINSDPTRPSNHSAHLLVHNIPQKGENKKIVGFKCNCGKGIYHSFDYDGRIKWRDEISVTEMYSLRVAGSEVEIENK